MRRSLFEKYIPEVAKSLSEILGIPLDKAEKPFYSALPSFVRLVTDSAKDEPNGKGSAGAPPAADAAPAESPKAAKPRLPAKTKPPTPRRRGEQLSLPE